MIYTVTMTKLYYKLNFIQCSILLLHFFALWGLQNLRVRAISAYEYESTNNETTTRTKDTKNNEPIIIYTYFEKIDISNRTTGMTDEDDSNLLNFWKETWKAAGYMPIILTAEDIMISFRRHYDDDGGQITTTTTTTTKNKYLTKDRYDSITSKLDNLNLDDFSRILFHRWIAMAAVDGGWFADYDNFPLRRRRRQQSYFSSPQPNQAAQGRLLHLQEQLPNDGKMTLHDILSPTLASGSGKEWLDTLNNMLDDAEKHCQRATEYRRRHDDDGRGYYDSQNTNCFWTDSLGIHSLRTNNNHNNNIPAPKTSRQVAVPFDKDDPVSFNDPKLCSSKNFQNKLTVHFGGEILQRGKYVPSPKDRLPKYRLKLARNWLDRWHILCDDNDTDSIKSS
jgi:hypothetical protein